MPDLDLIKQAEQGVCAMGAGGFLWVKLANDTPTLTLPRSPALTGERGQLARSGCHRRNLPVVLAAH